MVRCFPFLDETSESDVFLWTASTSTDGANGPNSKSLAGMDVEKLRGECTTCGPEMSLRWVMARENFEIAPFFTGNRCAGP